jgi:hypothetical protein
MKSGDVIICPVYSIAHILKSIIGEGLVCELVEKRGQYFLKYRVSEEELGHTYEQMFWKFRFICVGLSVATIGHFWVQDELLNEELKSLWKREKAVKLVVDKEIMPTGASPLTANDILIGEDITTWIANNYPRVFNYYTIGLFLLRSSLPAEYLYAEVLLNFFKIVELITYKRINSKPDLKTIIADAKALNIVSVDEADIKQFYVLRCNDAAHDYDKVRGISRKQAVECKMWVDELIVKDLISRAEKPTFKVEVTESSSGAVIRPIYDETK